MRNQTLAWLRKIYQLVTVLIVLTTLGLLVWTSLKFGDFLIGKISVDSGAQILTTLDSARLERLRDQMLARLNQPNAPEAHNPFSDLIKSAPEPAPVQ